MGDLAMVDAAGLFGELAADVVAVGPRPWRAVLQLPLRFDSSAAICWRATSLPLPMRGAIGAFSTLWLPQAGQATAPALAWLS